jgi:hypothetical protein
MAWSPKGRMIRVLAIKIPAKTVVKMRVAKAAKDAIVPLKK